MDKEAMERRLREENLVQKRRIAAAMARGRDAKTLTPDEEAARASIRRKSIADKAAMEHRLAEENVEMRRRIELAQSRGRDEKNLTPEQERGRAFVAQRSRDEKSAGGGEVGGGERVDTSAHRRGHGEGRMRRHWTRTPTRRGWRWQNGGGAKRRGPVVSDPPSPLLARARTHAHTPTLFEEFTPHVTSLAPNRVIFTLQRTLSKPIHRVVSTT